MPAADDKRTTSQVMRQWQKLNQVKRHLVKQGVVGEEATPSEVIEALRKEIPQDLFAS